jgi:hypothetical protein
MVTFVSPAGTAGAEQPADGWAATAVGSTGGTVVEVAFAGVVVADVASDDFLAQAAKPTTLIANRSKTITGARGRWGTETERRYMTFDPDTADGEGL